jgi:peptidylprolyl isomerase/FKBP-type peptidyl-prolyl cis-trans isomerase FklB
MRRLAPLLLGLALAACSDPRAVDNLRFSKAFLAATARQPGVVTLPSGLQYRVLRAGKPGAASPRLSDQVLVQYEGRLPNGQVFDSSYQHGAPAAFTVSGLVPAWTEALQRMRPGEMWMLIAPPQLGYGERGAGPIPPNSALVFRIELLAVLPQDASVGGG